MLKHYKFGIGLFSLLFLVIGSTFAFEEVFAAASDTVVFLFPGTQTAYQSSDTGELRVTDAARAGSGSISVDLFSTSDVGGISILLGETGPSSGVFQATFTFTTTDESSANKIRVADGDTITGEGAEGIISTTAKIDDTVVAPTIDSISDDTGISSSDEITTDTTPAITGTAENNASVQVFDNAVSLGFATADSSGDWTFPVTSAFSDGTHPITAKQTDLAGNVSGLTSDFDIVVDNAAPTTPGDPALDADDDTGRLSNDRITKNTSDLTISGSADTGTIVKLFDNNVLLDSQTALSYSFEISLTEGVHPLNVTSTDAAGNTATSGIVNITVDTTDPTAPPNINLNDLDDSGRSATDNITDDLQPRINGTGVEALAIVALSSDVDAGGIGTVTANGAGEWQITAGASDLTEGTHAVTATQEDEAGNVSPSSAALSPALKLDNTNPTAPPNINLNDLDDSGRSATDNITNNINPRINGTGVEAIAIVALTSSVDAGIGTIIANGAGEWQITTGNSALTDDSHTVTATQEDVAGNVSPSSAALSPALVIDTQVAAPTALDLSESSDTSGPTGVINDHITFDATPNINGTTAEAGQVELFDTDGTTSLGTVDVASDWNKDTTTLADGEHTIKTKLTDVAGNLSDLSDSSAVIEIDTVIIPTTTVPDLRAADDSGDSDTDNKTNVTLPGFTGTTEDTSTVQLRNGTDTNGLSIVTIGGAGPQAYTVIVTDALLEGNNAMDVTVEDAAGNSINTADLIVLIDITPPPTRTVDIQSLNDTALDRFTYERNDQNIALTCNDAVDAIAVSGCFDTKITGDIEGTPVFEPFVSPEERDFTSERGIKNISVEFRDLAGNSISTPDSIRLDAIFSDVEFASTGIWEDFEFNISGKLKNPETTGALFDKVKVNMGFLVRTDTIGFVDSITDDSTFEVGEPLYEDRDGSGDVSVDDVRLLGTIDDGTTVIGGDADIGTSLESLDDIRFVDSVIANSAFDAGEPLFIDVDESGDVSIDDIPLASLTPVTNGGTDQGDKLTSFNRDLLMNLLTLLNAKFR